MIQQIESRFPSIRGYGCLMMSYVWLVSQKYKINFTMKEIEELFLIAVMRKVILDNDKPLDGSEGEWYRCWIAKPDEWLKLVAASIGKNINPKLLFNSPLKKQAKYIIVENVTQGIKTFKGFKTGIHFTAEIDGLTYNPDVRIKLASVKSYRGWEL